MPNEKIEDLADAASWRRRRDNDRREYFGDLEQERTHERAMTGETTPEGPAEPETTDERYAKYVEAEITAGHLRPGGPCETPPWLQKCLGRKNAEGDAQ